VLVLSLLISWEGQYHGGLIIIDKSEEYHGGLIVIDKLGGYHFGIIITDKSWEHHGGTLLTIRVKLDIIDPLLNSRHLCNSFRNTPLIGL
jgi:hypothetical protein